MAANASYTATGGIVILVDREFPDAALLEGERSILSRVARGGPLADVLRDLIELVEKPSGGEMLASVLFVSEDGTRLLEGAAPSLPAEYNSAIHGLAIGHGVGSCGTAAYTGEPVFVADIANHPFWKDFRDVARAHGLAACWSVPIKSSEGKVLGTFANYYREPRAPTQRDMQIIETVAQTAAIAIERHRADVARARAEEQRKLLLQELNHRVKNAFAIASALVTLGARSAASPAELAAAVHGKLATLSRAYDLLVARLSDGDGVHADAALHDILAAAVAPYALSDRKARTAVHGPDVRIAARALTDVTLIFHELATNAAKYGALSVVDGQVDVAWELKAGTLRIDWRERGGPAVVAPEKTGFGSTLAKRTVQHQIGGSIVYDWAPDGLNVTIEMPLSRIAP